MLVRVYTCQNVKLLEISCSGSLILIYLRVFSGLNFIWPRGEMHLLPVHP